MKTMIADALLRMTLLFDKPLLANELDILADMFLEALRDESPRAVRAAFAAWRREGRRMPFPADIIDRLPSCRAALSAAAAQPESDDTTHTPGYPSFLAARRRVDDEALARLEQTYGKDAMRRFETMLAGVVEACDVRQ